MEAIAGPEARLEALVRKAEAFTANPTPSLCAVVALLKPLIEKGANPVVFCRFMATSRPRAFRDYRIRVDRLVGQPLSNHRNGFLDAIALRCKLPTSAVDELSNRRRRCCAPQRAARSVGVDRSKSHREAIVS